jgi:hypothetical protein
VRWRFESVVVHQTLQFHCIGNVSTTSVSPIGRGGAFKRRAIAVRIRVLTPSLRSPTSRGPASNAAQWRFDACRGHHGTSRRSTIHIAAKRAAMLIGILVTLLVVVLILYLINLLPLDPQAMLIARVIIAIIYLLGFLPGGPIL